MKLESFLNVFSFTSAASAIVMDIFVESMLWLLSFVLIKNLLSYHLKKIANKTTYSFDDTLVNIINEIKLAVLVVIAVWISIIDVELSRILNTIINALFTFAIAYQLNNALNQIVDYVSRQHVEKKQQQGPVNLVKIAISLAIWILAILLFLSNSGVNITSLVTGLGIGGIAVALAVQNILGDLLSSLSIYFDKPFQTGDFITVGTDKGTVEHIGIKTTRIKTFQGQELIIPNKDITSARVNNFEKMQDRKVKFSLSVDYDTPLRKLKKINELITSVSESVENIELNRVHLVQMTESALLYEGLYTVTTSDFNIYLDSQQLLLFGILEVFDKEGIRLAYPTTTVHLIKN